MNSSPNLDQLTAEQLRALAAQLLTQVDAMGKKIHRDQTVIEQLTHEIAWYKRHKFAKRSEQLSPDQGSLLDDLLDTDIAAIEAELKAVNPLATPAEPRQQPKRTPLPPQFPRTVIRHEPENTQCACGCQLQRIGEDVSEKLDYTPGVFTVEQHVRGKWACRHCETLIRTQARLRVEHVFDDLQQLVIAHKRNPIFEHLIGYIYSVEQGDRNDGQGYHIHAAYFFNGNVVCRDVWKAIEIGGLWEDITRGQGYMESCNHDKDRYGDECGIGQIQRGDQAIRPHIHRAMKYLVKNAQHLRLRPQGARCLRTGQLKHPCRG